MKFFLFTENLLKYICIFLFVFLVGAVSFQIISRVFTGRSFVIIEELSIFLLAWCTFLSAAYAAKKKAHIKIDFFVEKIFTENGRKILNLILNIVLLLVISYLIIISFSFVGRQMKVSMAVLPIKKGLMYLSFPVGMLFLVIFLLEDILLSLKRNN